jgi:hypothetical protein
MEWYFQFQQKEKNHSCSLGSVLLNRAKLQKDIMQQEAYKTVRPHARMSFTTGHMLAA